MYGKSTENHLFPFMLSEVAPATEKHWMSRQATTLTRCSSPARWPISLGQHKKQARRFENLVQYELVDLVLRETAVSLDSCLG